MKQKTKLKIIIPTIMIAIILLLLLICMIFGKELSSIPYALTKMLQGAAAETIIDLTGTATGPNVNHTCLYETKYNSTQHWQECCICYNKINIKTHNLYTTGTDNCYGGNRTRKTYCTEGCGYNIQIAAKEHIEDPKWYTALDQRKHFKKCNICGEWTKAEFCKNAQGEILGCTTGKTGTCATCGHYYTEANHGITDSNYNSATGQGTGKCQACQKTTLSYTSTKQIINGTTTKYTAHVTPQNGTTLTTEAYHFGTCSALLTPLDISNQSIIKNKDGSLDISVTVSYPNNMTNQVDIHCWFYIYVDGQKQNTHLYFMPGQPDNSPPVPKNISVSYSETQDGFSRKSNIEASFTETYDTVVEMALFDSKGNMISGWGATTKNGTTFNKNFDVILETTEEQTLTVKARDRYGNIGQNTIKVKALDSKPPTFISATVYNDKWTKEKILKVQATDLGIGKVQIAFNNEGNSDSNYQLGTYEYNSSLGKWVYTRTYRFVGEVYQDMIGVVYLKDGANNKSQQKITIGKLDNTAPSITNLQIVGEKVQVTANDNHTIYGAGSGIAGYKYVAMKNGEEVEKYTTQNIINLSEFAGMEFIFVKPVDNAGNLGKQIELELPQYEITINANGGLYEEEAIVKLTGVYGMEEYLIEPEKEGYRFAGWNLTGAGKIEIDKDLAQIGYTEYIYTYGLGIATITAKWADSTETPYQVKHHKMRVDGAGYELEEQEEYYGTIGTSVTPETKTYEGFKTPNKQTISIGTDGKTVVNYYYERNIYKLSINKGIGVERVDITGDNVGDFIETETKVETSFYYEAEIKLEVYMKEGFSFSKWEGDRNYYSETINLTMGEQNTVLEAKAALGESRVMVDPAGGVWKGSDQAQIFIGEYGSTLDIPIPTADGYIFTGWQRENNYGNMSSLTENATYTFGGTDYQTDKLTATWKNGIATTYTVNYYMQNIGAGSMGGKEDYTLKESETIPAIAYENIEIKPKEYEGFTTPESEWISPEENGVTVIDYYYTRNSYNININKGIGILELNIKGKTDLGSNGNGVNIQAYYGETLEIESEILDGCSFLNYTWEGNNSSENPMNFTVQGKNTTITANARIGQSILVINPNKGTWKGETKVQVLDPKQGSKITIENPVRDGYVFKGWSFVGGGEFEGYLYEEPQKENSTYTFAEEGAIITANWGIQEGGNNRVTVEHYKMDKDGVGYTLIETSVEYGEYGETITGQTKTYEGFTSPEKQSAKILEDGSSKIRYNYTRNQYILKVNLGLGVKTVEGREVAQGTKDYIGADKLEAKFYYEGNINLQAILYETCTWKNWTGNYDFGAGNQTTTITMPAKNLEITANAEIPANTLIVDPNGGTFRNTKEETVVNKAVGEEEVIEDPSREGYIFTGWSSIGGGSFTKNEKGENVYIFEKAGGILKATWLDKTKADTSFKVNHYTMNLDGKTYSLKDIDTISAESGSMVEANQRGYIGFTRPSKQTVTIAVDGSTVVNYYYTRNKYTVTIKASEGISRLTAKGNVVGEESGKQITKSFYYEETVKISANTEKGYLWSKWQEEGKQDITASVQSFAMGNEARTLTAVAVKSDDPNVEMGRVIVEHKDKKTGEVLETIVLDGKVGSLAVSHSKDFKDYILSEKPKNIAVLVTKEEQILTYYYEKITGGENGEEGKGAVIEKHMDSVTGEILENAVTRGNAGDTYEIKEKAIEGYDIDTEKLPENNKGNIKEGVIEVKYYYKRITKVEVSYEEKETGKQLAEKVIIEGHEEDTYQTEEKKITYYDLIEKPENREGKMTVSYYLEGENLIVDTTTKVVYPYKAQEFDLKVEINIAKIIKDGVEEENISGKVVKQEIVGMRISSTKLSVQYKVKVSNVGKVEGKTSIVGSIPEGFTIDKAKNVGWTIKDNTITRQTENLKAGEEKEYLLVLDWVKSEKNFGEKITKVSLMESISTAGFKETNIANNEDKASVIMSIKTGLEIAGKIGIGLVITGVVSLGVVGIYRRKRR